MTDLARQNMIERQIRTWEVLDDNVLRLYADPQLRREDFVPEDKKHLAYADLQLPIADGQYMLEPKLEARMLQTLALSKDDKVLHIGAGSGFFAALLGRLAAQVISVENRPALARAAAARLAPIAPNVAIAEGDGARGRAPSAPYTAIVLTGAAPILAEEFTAQLAEGGRALAVVGSAPAMTLRLHRKLNGRLSLHQDILETVIPMLDNAPDAAAFSF